MNEFGLTPQEFPEVLKQVDYILSYEKNVSPPLQKLRYLIITILYKNTTVTPVHKTVLFLLHKEGLNVNQRYFYEPLFFECGKSHPEFNQHPLPHTIDLLDFLVDHCDMNIHMTNPNSYLYEIVKNINHDTEMKIEIIQWILKKGNWITYETQFQNAFFHFVYYSLNDDDPFKKKVFISFLLHSSQSMVQKAFDMILQRLSKDYFQNNDTATDQIIKIIFTILFRYGFLIHDENNELLNVIQEGEICQYYSLFV